MIGLSPLSGTMTAQPHGGAMPVSMGQQTNKRPLEDPAQQQLALTIVSAMMLRVELRPGATHLRISIRKKKAPSHRTNRKQAPLIIGILGTKHLAQYSRDYAKCAEEHFQQPALEIVGLAASECAEIAAMRHQTRCGQSAQHASVPVRMRQAA